MKGVVDVGKNLPNPQVAKNPSSNYFVVLSIDETHSLEEGELQHLEG